MQNRRVKKLLLLEQQQFEHLRLLIENIYPPYEFKVIDELITNFHLPKSTLLMLVSALAGKEFIFEAYKKAVEEKYHIFGYGDCMLIK